MSLHRTSRISIITATLTGMLFLSACGLQIGPQATPTPTIPPAPTATATPAPKVLTVCIGQEPETLYLYGGSSRSMWSVLEGVYDGPVDTVNYEPSPVLLAELPTLENGGVTLRSAAVTEGDEVANIEGDMVALKQGVMVFPEGCTSPECAQAWDGSSALKLVQMVVKLKLLDGVKWSDGQPLTAEDSVFSYTVSTDPATEVTKTNIQRTASYTAVDDVTVEWVGKPGYLAMTPASFFWIPLPQHQLSNLTPEQMNTDALTTRTPLGWGPYVVNDWKAGESIRLAKNPNYYRAAEGLPYFDFVEYRFLSGMPEADISPVVNGTCDIIDSSVNLSTQIQPLREQEITGTIKAYFGSGPEWEGLNFGIKPASYDDGYNPYTDRADYFGDVRVRQAFAYCIDREKITRTILLYQSNVPTTFAPPNHPMITDGLSAYAYNPATGMRLLEEVGWLDHDGDPVTPRKASNVSNVLNDTEFTIIYYLTDSELHRNVAGVIVDSLGVCGIRVSRSYLAASDMYATGADGLVFGRNFDLAELAWTTGRQLPCFLYASTEIPANANKWLGTRFGGVNFTGYSNAEYDAACAQSLTAGLNRELLVSNSRLTQQLLASELPVLPLFYHVTAAASRPDLCGLTLDVSSRSALRDLEGFSLSDSCPAE